MPYKHTKLPFPKTVGTTLERLAKVRAERKALEADVAAAKFDENALEVHSMALLKAQKLTNGVGGGLKAEIDKVTYYNPEDWDQIWAFIVKHKAYDLVHRRLGARAAADRFEAGVKIPGVRVVADVEVLKVKEA